MNHWLLKSEPAEWSWDDQVNRGDTGEEWTGVRNYQARNMMREMRVGDHAIFYHSQTERACRGIVRIIAAAHPDPTDTTGKWDCITVAAERPLDRPVTLAEIKADRRLRDTALVRRPRLSVQPLTADEWRAILDMATGSA